MPIVTGSQILAADVNSIGSGHIFIGLFAYSSIGQGTWAFRTPGAPGWGADIFDNDGSVADGDNISFKVYLAKGTYTLAIVTLKGANAAIVDFDIDGGEVASFDLYNAGALQNQRLTDTGNVIATEGLKTLRMRVDGKNGSSSAYYAFVQMIILWRTA